MLSWKNEGAHPLSLGARRAPIFLRARRAPIFLRARAPIFQKGMCTHYSKSNQMENKWMNTYEYKKESQKNEFMKYSLEKWGRAPIILGVLVEHPLF
jgi:hypothetical protein